MLLRLNASVFWRAVDAPQPSLAGETLNKDETGQSSGNPTIRVICSKVVIKDKFFPRNRVQFVNPRHFKIVADFYLYASEASQYDAGKTYDLVAIPVKEP